MPTKREHDKKNTLKLNQTKQKTTTQRYNQKILVHKKTSFKIYIAI